MEHWRHAPLVLKDVEELDVLEHSYHCNNEEYEDNE